MSEAEYNVGVAYRDGSGASRDLDRALASFLAAMHAEPKSVVGMMAACEAASMLLVQAHCTRANLTSHEELSVWLPAASANATDVRTPLEAMDRVLQAPATADAAAHDSSQRLASRAQQLLEDAITVADKYRAKQLHAGADVRADKAHATRDEAGEAWAAGASPTASMAEPLSVAETVRQHGDVYLASASARTLLGRLLLGGETCASWVPSLEHHHEAMRPGLPANTPASPASAARRLSREGACSHRVNTLSHTLAPQSCPPHRARSRDGCLAPACVAGEFVERNVAQARTLLEQAASLGESCARALLAGMKIRDAPAGPSPKHAKDRGEAKAEVCEAFSPSPCPRLSLYLPPSLPF